jgi:DNA polymerase
MVIGEAPGAEEDQQGEPFVGQAGKLLDNMLRSVGASRERNVLIANVLKCRPPGNRNPEPAEVAACASYLMRQIELAQPEFLLLLGKFAASSLLRTEGSMASLRGRTHRVDVGGRSIPAVVSYHPAYLLRRPEEKAKAWADLKLAVRAMQP